MRVVFVALVAAMVAVHEPVTVEDVDSAIRWLTRGAPRNPMQARPELRGETARAIHAAAAETDLDPYLLTAMSFRESSFRTGARGELGEIGVMQVHGRPLKECRQAGLDMSRIRDQTLCSARYLRAMVDHCGGVTKGLTAYASGSCTPRTDRTARLVASRLRMAKRLASRPWEE